MRENVFSVTRSMVSLSPYRGKKISETEGLSEGIKAGFFCRGGEKQGKEKGDEITDILAGGTERDPAVQNNNHGGETMECPASCAGYG